MIDFLQSFFNNSFVTLYSQPSLSHLQGLLTGTLDQKNGLLRVKSVMARDVKVTEIDALIETLVTWKKSIGQLSEAVQQSSWYMSDQRQQAQEEKKSAQEMYDLRKKDIKVYFWSHYLSILRSFSFSFRTCFFF